MNYLMTTDDHIKLSPDSLRILRNVKNDALEELRTERQKAVSEASGVVGNPEPMMVWAWLQPVLSTVREEEDVKKFAKLLVAIFRLTSSIEKLQKEVAAVDMLLDDQGPLSLATVDFDGIKVIEDDERGSN